VRSVHLGAGDANGDVRMESDDGEVWNGMDDEDGFGAIRSDDESVESDEEEESDEDDESFVDDDE
jgi:hypothetical protein